MHFQGYVRKDGPVGIRHTVLLLAVRDCGEPTAR